MSSTCGYLHSAIYCFLFNWQTLVTGFMALGAAWWTISKIQTQILLQKDFNRDEAERYAEQQEREMWAARAHMHDALSGLCVFTENCFGYIASDHNPAAIPQSPVEDIAVFKSGIRHLDRQSADQIKILISKYQVHNSRLFNLASRQNLNRTAQQLVDLAELRWYIERVFDYARYEVDAVPVSEPNQRDIQAAMGRAMQQNLNYQFTHVAEWTEFQRRAARSFPPGPPFSAGDGAGT